MLTIDTKINEGSLESTGFWYKDYILYPIFTTHVRAVLDYPSLFGTTKESLIEVYRKHNEKIGLEGKAREEIIRKLVDLGWVRIRHYRTPKDYWSFQISYTTNETDEVRCLIAFMRNRKYIRNNDEIRINGVSTRD